MSYYFRKGNTFRQAANKSIDLTDKLPAGTYTLKVDSLTGEMFFEIVDSFELPKKLYGDCSQTAERIINTFHDRPNATGVLLEGEKGSGKTLLAKVISNRLIEQGIPTIVINQPFLGDGFNTFVQSLSQPACFVFDEFEKVYDADQQEQVLTLFDGVYPSKKLFIITSNDKYRIDIHMRNRPGRIFYMLSFDGLSKEFIEEYATENLNDKTQVASILTLSVVFPKFNFDMLKALIEEMNRYGETAQQAIRMLNTKPEKTSEVYEVKIIIDGEPLTRGQLQEKWAGNPLSQQISLEWEFQSETDEDDYEYRTYDFKNEDLKKIDANEGKFIYVNDKDEMLVLTKPVKVEYKWSEYLL